MEDSDKLFGVFLIRGLRKNQNVSVLLGEKPNIRLKGFNARVRIIKIYRKKLHLVNLISLAG